MYECKQENCPFRSNPSSSIYGCEHIACPNRDDGSLIIPADKVKKAPTLTPLNEWVNVEDAMPPEHEPVLCIVSGRPKPNITLVEAYQLGSWNKEDGWIIDEYLYWEDADVLWWCKLPAPPDRRPPEGEANA